MIETIYSNENGEADRANKVQSSFKMPKNIRQVGKSNALRKIYVEDYVMTFIKQLAGGDYSGCKVAVLVGQSVRMDNCRNIFISGAVEVSGVDAANEIIFTNDTWTGIYEDIKKYFVETEIVGWFIGGPGYLLVDEEKILKAHVDNFAGQDKVLLSYDNMEREETFLCYENSRLSKQDGYYIYYEKNDEMQSYIIEHKNPASIEAEYDDKVSRDIRTVLKDKKPSEEESKSVTRLMYAAGTLLAVIVLVVGAAMLSNYDQMKNMQKSLSYLSKSMEDVQAIFNETNITPAIENQEKTEGAIEETTDISDDENSNLDVEVKPGNIEPKESSDTQSQNKNNSDNPKSDAELADDTEKAGSSSDSEAGTKNAEENTKKAADELKYYTVTVGDTLADISYKLYNTYTKVDEIMTLNNIKDQDLIFVGQKLIVP